MTAVNTSGASGLLSRNSGGASTFYEFDAQGGVAQRLDGGGRVLRSDRFDAFGGDQNTSAAPDPWGFGARWGGYTDAETGLVLCTHRYYDPAAGRWLTRDPAGYAGGIDLYAYCQNDPIDNDDPLGFGYGGVVVGGTIGAGLFGAGGGISGSAGIAVDGYGHVGLIWSGSGFGAGAGEIAEGGIGATGGNGNLTNGTSPVGVLSGNGGLFSGTVTHPVAGGGGTQVSGTIGPGEGVFLGAGTGVSGCKIIGTLPPWPEIPPCDRDGGSCYDPARRDPPVEPRGPWHLTPY